MYWNAYRKKIKIFDRVNKFLATEIDLTAEVKFSDTLQEAYDKATAKYYCAWCNKRISFRTYSHHDGMCKRCECIHSSKDKSHTPAENKA